MTEKQRRLLTHDFRMPGEETIPFEIFSFHEMTVASRILMQNTPPHRHTFYEVIFCTGGKGTHFIDFVPYPHKPPVIYFISPGQVHYWDHEAPPIANVLLITEEFLLASALNQLMPHEFSFFHSVIDKPVLHLSEKQSEELALLIKAMKHETVTRGFGMASVIRAYLQIFFVQAQRMHDAANVDSHPADSAGHSDGASLVRRFKQLVSKDFTANRTVNYYADNLGVSVAHLSDVVKRMTGISPGNTIRQEVALEAKRLLAHTDLGVAEIGYRLAFEDPSYFGRFFKREARVSPLDFRSSIRKKYHLNSE